MLRNSTHTLTQMRSAAVMTNKDAAASLEYERENERVVSRQGNLLQARRCIITRVGTQEASQGFYGGIKGGFLKTMKVEGAQGAEARTAEDGRGEKLKADGGGKGLVSG